MYVCVSNSIKDLEAQREQGNTRIAQLEEELVEDQRKKVRENVELIRLNRSLALQAVQVAALEAEKQTLERDREQLQEALRQAITENELIRVQLMDTKNQLTSLGVELQDSHEQQQRSRDLEDELKESQQEKEILKEYNSRLLSLSHAENSQEQLQNQKYEDLQERLSEMQLKLDTLSDSRAVIADQDMCSSPRQQSSPAKEPSLLSQVTLVIILIVTTRFIDRMLQGATLAVDKTANVGKMKATHLQSKLEQELSEKTKLMQLLEQLQNHQQEERPTENSAQEKLIREQVRILEDSLKREQEERESLGKKIELEKQEVFKLRQEHHQMLEKLHTLESIMGNTNTLQGVNFCNITFWTNLYLKKHSEQRSMTHICRTTAFSDLTVTMNLLLTNSQTGKTTNDRHTLAFEKTQQMTHDVPSVNFQTVKSNAVEGETSKRREKPSLREQESNQNLQNDLISEAEVYEDQVKTSTFKELTGNLTNNTLEDNSPTTEPNTQGLSPSILNSSTRYFISDDFLSSDVDKQDPRSKPQEKHERIPSLLQTASVVMSHLHSANSNEHTRKLTLTEPMHFIAHPSNPSYLSLEPSNFMKDKFLKKGRSISEANVQLLNPSASDTDSASLRVLIAAPLEPLAENNPLQENTDVQTRDGCIDQVPPPKDSSHIKIRKFSDENEMKIIPSDHECLSTHLDDSPVILNDEYHDTMPPSPSEDLDQTIVHSSNEKLSKASHLELARELTRCQELLRMQCNLNAVYKKELVSLGQQLSQRESNEAKMISNMKKIIQSQMCHINKLHKDTLTNSERFTHRLSRNEQSSLAVGQNQGLFEIHIQHLKLYPEFASLWNSEMPGVFLSWVFFDKDVAKTPTNEGLDIDFSHSVVYRVDINHAFFNYLLFCSNFPVPRRSVRWLVVSFFHAAPVNKQTGEEYCEQQSNTPKKEENSNSQEISVIRNDENLDEINVVASDREENNEGSEDSFEEEEVEEEGQRLGQGALHFAELLDYPNNKLHLTIPIVGPHENNPHTELGILQCWFRMNCLLDQIENFKDELKKPTPKVLNPEHYSPSSSLPYKLSQLSESLIPSMPIPEVYTHESPPSEVPILKASLSEDLMPATPKPAARRKKKSPSFRKPSVIKKVHSIVIAPADERISVLEKVPILDETSPINDYHKTMTISAVVHPTPAPRKSTTGLADPPKKSNENRGDEKTATTLIPAILPVAQQDSKVIFKEGPEEDELVIDINYLWLAPLSSPMLDFALKQFYIDYTFLEYFGENMETKSVHRSEIIDNSLHFNYSEIDKSTHGHQHKLLAQMFNKSTSDREECKIRFVVVSEPLDEDSSMQDCGEIGYAVLDMVEVLNYDGNWANIDIAVINYNGDMIGTLNINIGGIDTIKKVARELNIPQ
uniref:RPGRIP1 C-terminal domain-containing protein n=1 Tax=Timema poppense TaxID=170557 RepID=A0A7R9CZX6_TIMPO|nr:unnamed protein product [Timema poppensis]